MQCLGRLTKEKKNVPVFKFENKPKYGFFTAVQCSNPADGELCTQCLAKQEKIPELLTKWKGSMQNQSQQLHGLINGEIPEWSRIYGGAWVNSKLREGFTISDEVLKILGAETRKDSMTNTIEMEIETEKKPRKKAIKKEVVKPVEVVKPIVKPVEVVKPIVKPLKNAKKKVVTAKQTAILGVVDPVPLEEPIVVKIKVRQIEIDGRTVYLNNTNDKVYDMKFNYLGRYNRKDDCIDSSYRDSDEDGA